MNEKKTILLIATGGTIASCRTSEGLTPQITAEELLQYVPEVTDFCQVDVVQPFSLDSTNVRREHWLNIAALLEENYSRYDGFVICHGTDTMAYTAAALSYLVQNNEKPIIVTGAQKPINLDITDARMNLRDSLRLACDPQAAGTCIVFDGHVIAGTHARKERSHSYNAFSSINLPVLAVIRDEQIIHFIDNRPKPGTSVTFYHEMADGVLLLRLVPGMEGSVLDALMPAASALVIESFGLGGVPEYGERSLASAIADWSTRGKLVILSTQVTNEGSDMGVYRVGRRIRECSGLIEAGDMTTEALITKTMWLLGQHVTGDEFRRRLQTPVAFDLLSVPRSHEQERS